MDEGILSRTEAIRILFRWIRTQEFPGRTIGGVAPALRGFVMELTYATVRWARLLDAVLEPRLRQRPPAETEAALLLGACQLLKLPEIPGYAAVHATVEALKRIGGRRSPVGLLNAVLRDLDRNRESLLAEIQSWPPALRLSHPDALVEDWTRRWDAARAEAICAWNNQPADVAVLTLPLGPRREEILARFLGAGIVAEPHPECGEALLLGHGVRIEELPGFDSGDFAVQDPATLDAVRLLDVQSGQRVLDACAAPGGKAARIARLLGGQGRLLALERHADRLPPLRATLARLAPPPAAPGASWEIRTADAATVTPDELGGRFDRILLDVPCSNTGVLRRRPDARWRVDAERTARLLRLQAQLIENAAALLAPGGRIVYSTCSLQRSENEDRVAQFLERHRDFVLLDQVFRAPPGMDGAFAAALGRAAEA